MSEAEIGAEDSALFGKMTSIKPLVDALACLSQPSRAHDVIVSQGSAGLRFSTATPTHQASAILPPSAFTTLRVNPADLRIRLNLSALQDCLAVLSAATPTDVQLSFSNARLGVRCTGADECSIHAQLAALHAPEQGCELIEPSDATDVAAFIIGADAFRDALTELDYASAQTVQLSFIPEQPCVRFVAPANCGDGQARVVVELMEQSNGFQTVRCDGEQSATLRTEHVLRATRALGVAESVKVVLNEAGVVSIVCRLKGSGVEDRSFVELVMLAQEIEDGEEEDGEEEEHERGSVEAT